MEIKWELNSVQQNQFLETQFRWLHLCCSSPNPSVLPQHPGAHLHVPHGAAVSPRHSSGLDAAPCHGPALLAQGPQHHKSRDGQEPLVPAGWVSSQTWQVWPEEKIAFPVPSSEYDNICLPLVELHWLLLQYSSKYVQIKESSGAEVQTPNWILRRLLENFSSDCFFQGPSHTIFKWTLNQLHLLNLCNLENWTWEGHIPYCFGTHLPLTLLCLSW